MSVREIESRLVNAVSRDGLMEFNRGIARWVRLSGTPEELEAFRWVEERMKSFGLQTRLLFHDAYISLPGKASLEVDGLGPIAAITHSMARPGAVEGEIVYGHDADAAGKVLMTDGLATPTAVLAAQARGARALLVVNDAHHHEMIVSPVWGSPTVDDLHKLPRIVVLSIRYEDGQLIKDALGRGPVRARLSAEVDTRWRQTPILVAELPGASPDYVMFSGHLDSWHLGAMDNGSANATMMEVGRLMATVRDKLRRGLKIVFWSGHSHGRYSGSTWYVDNHWQDLRDHCVAHVNIDSVGGKGAVVLSEGMAHPEYVPLGRDVIRQYTGMHYEGRRVNRSSDQSFVGVGIPSLWAMLSEQPPGEDGIGFTRLFGGKSGGLGWWWHTVEDTMDKLDPALVERDCKCYVAAIARLCLEERLPLDPAAGVRAFAGHLDAYARKAEGRFDLSPALRLAERLLAAAERLTAANLPAEAFNRAALGVSRHLIPVEYTENGPFGHDPALEVPPIPCLRRIADLVAAAPGSDEEKFVRPIVTRGLNRVVHALRAALAEVEAHIEAHS